MYLAKVVNDAAKRGISLISDYIKVITKDEYQKHLNINYIRLSSDAKRKTLLYSNFSIKNVL